MVHKFKVAEGSLPGVVAIVTGANSGIGYETAKSLYLGGAHVILACRDLTKAQAAIDKLQSDVPQTQSQQVQGQLDAMEVDLSSLSSVRKFAQSYLDRSLPLHLLINNAGTMGADEKGEKNETTPDGFEYVFASNYMGHFLLTLFLLPKLKRTAKHLTEQFPLRAVRVINVTCKGHLSWTQMPDLEAQSEEKTSVKGWVAYGLSKFCVVAFTVELARRLKLEDKVETFAVDPGFTSSGLWRYEPSFVQTIQKVFMRSNKEGAYTTLYCAVTNNNANYNGQFFSDCEYTKRNVLTEDKELGKSLWDKSEQWVGLRSRK